jgi:eukaryotic-like serine/threonine-protein kinase
VVSGPQLVGASSEETLAAPPSTTSDGSNFGPAGFGRTEGTEDIAGTQIRFRRALTTAYVLWTGFIAIDWAAVHYLGAGRLWYFVGLRLAVLVVVCPPLVTLYRRRATSMNELTVFDVLAYGAAAVSIALMCLEFRGIASPYGTGLCVALLGRTVTAQDPWRRGLLMTGLPVLAYYVVLLGGTLALPHLRVQLHDPAALTTLALNSAYVVGTYVFMVVGGNVMWSLRQQVFEARNLGRYRLKRRIATGGMGDVWVAYHAGLKRDVAVKILRPDAQERSADAVSRFEREVRATAQLVHPNTVRVYDFGTTEDNVSYYVMELLDGETLAEHVDRTGPLPPARAVHVMGQAARALGEAHEAGIIHRDVKPSNLFLTSLGGELDFVKVLDFGIAKVETVGVAETRTGWLLGTPAYISPEVAMGKHADARSDVYALGAVLYFLLAGRPPFEGENAGSVVFAHMHEEPAPPSERLGKSLPRDVERVVMRALAKDPDERYATGAAFALALAGCACAGKWTLNDAVQVARASSRPPPRGAESRIFGRRSQMFQRDGSTPPPKRVAR